MLGKSDPKDILPNGGWKDGDASHQIPIRKKSPTKQIQVSPEKKKNNTHTHKKTYSTTFHYTGCLIGLFTTAYYNHHKIGG